MLRGNAGGFNPYEQERRDMMASILGKGPNINEAMEVGREAEYSEQKITGEMIMNFQAGSDAQKLRVQGRLPGYSAAGARR